MIGAAQGYRVALCIAASVSVERRRILEAMGAEVILTPADQRTDGAIREALRLKEKYPDRYFMPNQFTNPVNIQAHVESTGPEIYQQTDGQVDAFVAGMGTTGTLMGCSLFFRKHAYDVQVVGIEPPMGHRIQGLKNMNESIRPQIYDRSLLDDKIAVQDNEAFQMARYLASQKGIFTGMSGGAAVAGAVRVARRHENGTIVALLPDRGDRYLSTDLFKPAEPLAPSRVA
jgi:cysteine synthase B